MAKKFYIEHLGCTRRALDATRFAKYFIANGLEMTHRPAGADYMLYITCAARKLEEDISIRRIEELGRYKGTLIVGGCLPGINGKRLEESFSGPAFTPADEDSVDRILPDIKVKLRDVPDSHAIYPRSLAQTIKRYYFVVRLSAGFFHRLWDYLERRLVRKSYYLRIGWGCEDEHCTYCAIWPAIGKLKSKPKEKCLSEFREALAKGYRHVVIVADNSGAYGQDIGADFADLLGEMTAVNGRYAIEIEDLHPYWLIRYLDKLLPVFRKGKIRLIVSGVQSGSDRILRAMNRRYTGSEAKDAFMKIKEECPGIEIFTEIIAGFPSETEQEFEETLDLIRAVGFHSVSVFGYSENPFMRDPELLGSRIPEKVIKRRLKKSLEYCRKNRILCSII